MRPDNSKRDDLSLHPGHVISVSFFGQGVRALINLVSVMVLARLLSPQAYGLFAGPWIAVGILYTFRSSGLVAYALHTAALEHRKWSNLFWLNFLWCTFLTLFAVSCSRLVGILLKSESSVTLTCTLAGVLFLAGFNVQHQTLLRRQMRFSSLNLILILASVGAFIAALVLALCDAGYWSLAGFQIAHEAILSVLCWVAIGRLPSRWSRPMMDRNMLSYSWQATLSQFIQICSNVADQAIAAVFCKPSTLGMYNRMTAAMAMPERNLIEPLHSSILPVLGRLQHDAKRRERITFSLVNGISYPWLIVVIAILLLSPHIIQVILGPQWTNGHRLLSALAVAAFAKPYYDIINMFYLANGRTRELLLWTLFAGTIRIIALFEGATFGIFGIAAAHAASSVGLLILRIFSSERHIGVSASLFLFALRNPIILGTVFALGILAGDLAYPGCSSLLRLLISVLTGLTLCSIPALVLKSVRAELSGHLGTLFRKWDQ